MIRAYLYLALFIPLTVIVSASAVLSALADPGGRLHTAHTRLWGRIGLGLNGIRGTISGVEHLPDGPVILMCNHQSNFDILALLALLPRQFGWIAKQELFDIPLFGHAMRCGGFIPLDRGDGRSAMKSIDAAAEAIRGGRSILIFPEGTRSPDRRLLPFKRGGFILAMRAGVPVLPATINGSGRINPANTLLLNGGDIHITLHPPLIPPSGMGRAATEEWLISRTRGSIASVLETP